MRDEKKRGDIRGVKRLVAVSSVMCGMIAPAAAQSIVTNGVAQDAPLPFSTRVIATTDTSPSGTSASTNLPANTTTIGKTTQKDGKKADDKSGEPKVSDKKPPSPNATAALVNMLVEKKIITEDQAADIIKQADDEDYVGREAAKDATEKAADAAKAAKDAALAASPPGTKHVAYVPEVVKKQLRDEIKKEVMDQAQRENWASPGAYPEWASRIRMYGDIRTRYEGIFYPGGNAKGLPNFNAVNTGNPIDFSQFGLDSNQFPSFDTDQDRDRFRLRVRLGVDADLSDGFTAGIRIATGDSSTPVSTNQTFGGSGGDFSKYSLWLDRAHLDYKLGGALDVDVGRFDNPFFSPTDLVWDTDLGFDGLAIKLKHRIRTDLTTFAVAGAFPIFNTSLDFATNEDDKFKSDDKYLYGGQIGVGWTPDPLIGIKVAAAYYDFDNVRGSLSTPCNVLNASTACDSDDDRPSFAQKGNTYMTLRNIVPTNGDGSNNNGTTSQFQYFGLASDFQDVVLSGRIDFAHFDPVHIVVDGEFLDNVAFNARAISAVGINNFGPSVNGGPPGPFQGGSIGWQTRLTVGHQELNEFGDWSANVGYRFIESDATVDAFTDSDFGLGGTNLKGYFVGADFGLSKSVSTTMRWMSANSIAGFPYAVDVLQLDLNAKF